MLRMRYVISIIIMILGMGNERVQAESTLQWIEQHMYTLEYQEKIKKVWVSNPDLVDVHVQDNQLVVFTKNRGEVQLLVQDFSGQEQGYFAQITSKAREDLLHFLAIYLQDTGIEVTETPQDVYISGTVSEALYQSLQALAHRFNELELSQLKSFNQQDMIELEVQVVEVRRSYLKQQGLQWAGAAQGPSVGVLSDWLGGKQFHIFSEPSAAWYPNIEELSLQRWTGVNTYAGLQTSLSSTLRLLEERGEANILATPRLRVESGHTASFLAGGELPIPQLSRDGAMDVQFHPYGIRLFTKVNIREDGKIKTYIETELSSIDHAVSVQGVPGILTRKTESQVSLTPRQTLVLSGLKSRESQEQRSGLPGHASLWGGWKNVLSSHERSYQETELLIFITPRLVDEEQARRERKEQQLSLYYQELSQADCRMDV